MLGASSLAFGLGASPAAAGRPVNFFGWQDYDTALDVDGFFKAQGIELKPTYMTDNNEIIAAAKNGGIGNMDLVTPDLLYGPFMAELGILEPLDISKVPNFGGLFAPFKTIRGATLEGKNYCLPIAWGNVVLMYNADAVKEAPTSWFDLLKPEFKGKVGLTAEMSHLVIPLTMAVGKTATPTRVPKSLLDEVYATLTRIKKEQTRSLAPSFGDLASQFASGDIVIAPAWEPVSVWAGEKAPPLKWSFPVEGSFSFIDNMALIKDAPNKETAYLLMNQSLDPRVQANAANKNMTAVTVEAAVPLLNEKARSLFDYKDVAGFWAKRGDGMPPLWPVEKTGDLATLDDVLSGWETFLRA
jgi:putative spermidine/putrescine transport system substrate-binding protein/spermidine/putrescine transport system substrate-binding protein